MSHEFSKKEFLKRLREIKEMGWVPSSRQGNDGGVGNTLEDLLGIEENNIPLADWGTWELKAQRKNTSSLTTLFHVDPYPREPETIVAKVLLPIYGWPHKEAGKKYSTGEMSFRATLNCAPTDRGLCVKVNRKEKKVFISFDYKKNAVLYKIKRFKNPWRHTCINCKARSRNYTVSFGGSHY